MADRSYPVVGVAGMPTGRRRGAEDQARAQTRTHFLLLSEGGASTRGILESSADGADAGAMGLLGQLGIGVVGLPAVGGVGAPEFGGWRRWRGLRAVRCERAPPGSVDGAAERASGPVDGAAGRAAREGIRQAGHAEGRSGAQRGVRRVVPPPSGVIGGGLDAPDPLASPATPPDKSQPSLLRSGTAQATPPDKSQPSLFEERHRSGGPTGEESAEPAMERDC